MIKVPYPIPRVDYTYAIAQDDMPMGYIEITGLPIYTRQTAANGEKKMRYVSTSRIGRLVHSYKNLLTEGDAAGKREYNRKRKAHLPLQNPWLRLPMAYTICEKVVGESVNVSITFLCNTAGSAYILKDGDICTLTKREISNYLHDYSWMCFRDLEIYFQERLDTTPEGEVPDFYQFPA